MEAKKLKFHITITNNETGETLKDDDACAILGAYHIGEGAVGVAAIESDPFELAHTLTSAEHTIDVVKAQRPELVLLTGIMAKAMIVEADEAQEDCKE